MDYEINQSRAFQWPLKLCIFQVKGYKSHFATKLIASATNVIGTPWF